MLSGWFSYNITLQSSLFQEIRGRAGGLDYWVVAMLAEMQAMVAGLSLVGNLDGICYLPDLKTR